MLIKRIRNSVNDGVKLFDEQHIDTLTFDSTYNDNQK